MSLDSAVPLAWAPRAHAGATRPCKAISIRSCCWRADRRWRLPRGRSLRRARGGPFVFNLGHGILPETPPENVATLVEVVRGGAASA